MIKICGVDYNLAKNLFGLMVSKQDLKAQEDTIVLRMTLEIEKSRADSDAKHAATQLEIEKLRSDLVEKIERSKTDAMKWFAGLLLGQAALIATLVKLL